MMILKVNVIIFKDLRIMSNVYQELVKRGFIYQQTDEKAIEKKLSTENVVFYVGFDPTGDSLHVGHLLPVMAMRLLQKAKL